MLDVHESFFLIIHISPISKLRSIRNLHSLVTVAITCLKLKSIIYQSSSVVSAFVNRASIIGENCSFIEIFIAFCILNKTGFQINWAGIYVHFIDIGVFLHDLKRGKLDGIEFLLQFTVQHWVLHSKGSMAVWIVFFVWLINGEGPVIGLNFRISDKRGLMVAVFISLTLLGSDRFAPGIWTYTVFPSVTPGI